MKGVSVRAKRNVANDPQGEGQDENPPNSSFRPGAPEPKVQEAVKRGGPAQRAQPCYLPQRFMESEFSEATLLALNPEPPDARQS